MQSFRVCLLSTNWYITYIPSPVCSLIFSSSPQYTRSHLFFQTSLLIQTSIKCLVSLAQDLCVYEKLNDLSNDIINFANSITVIGCTITIKCYNVLVEENLISSAKLYSFHIIRHLLMCTQCCVIIIIIKFHVFIKKIISKMTKQTFLSERRAHTDVFFHYHKNTVLVTLLIRKVDVDVLTKLVCAIMLRYFSCKHLAGNVYSALAFCCCFYVFGKPNKNFTNRNGHLSDGVVFS